MYVAVCLRGHVMLGTREIRRSCQYVMTTNVSGSVYNGQCYKRTTKWFIAKPHKPLRAIAALSGAHGLLTSTPDDQLEEVVNEIIGVWWSDKKRSLKPFEFPIMAVQEWRSRGRTLHQWGLG